MKECSVLTLGSNQIKFIHRIVLADNFTKQLHRIIDIDPFRGT